MFFLKLPKKTQKASSWNNTGNDKRQRRSTWLCKARERVKDEQEKKAVDMKKSIVEHIQSIANNIDSLIHKNNSGDDPGSLDRSQIIIDEGRDRNRKSEIQDQAKHYRLQASTEIEDNIKISSRLQNHANAMINAFSKMHYLSLNSPSCVENFPLSLVSTSDRRKFDVVRRLKINEIFDMQRNINRVARGGMCWASFLNSFPSKILNYIFNLKTSASVAKKIDSSGNRNSYDSDDDMNSDVINTLTASKVPCPAVNLTYPPLSIRTNRQRRMQIMLVQLALRDLTSTFNKTYVNLAAEKNDFIHSINQALDKIIEICEELEISSDVCRPISNDIHLGKLKPSDRAIDESNDFKASDGRIEVSDHPGLMDMMNGTLKARSVSKDLIS